jgi:hypothetical protein
MKKIKLILAIVFCILAATFTTKAQIPTDYFAGKWSLLVTGTPQGDASCILELTRVDGKLTGTWLNSAKATQVVKISRVEEKEKSLTAYFTQGGYDVYIFLEKKDDNHADGSLMDMFDAKATRVVETQTQTTPPIPTVAK